MPYTFSETITDNEHSALLKMIIDPDAWVSNALRNKLRKSVLRVVEITLKDTGTYLKAKDRLALKDYVVANDLVMVHWRQWPQGLLDNIAGASLLPTAAEREASKEEAESI